MTVARHLRHTSEKSRFRFAGTTALNGRCLYNGKQREAADREATDPHHGFGIRGIILRPGRQREATGSNGKQRIGKQRIRTTDLGPGQLLSGPGSNGEQLEATDREETDPQHGSGTRWTTYRPGKQSAARGSNGSAQRIWDSVGHLPAREATGNNGKQQIVKQHIRTTDL